MAVFVILIIVYFAFGWQIGEINLYKLFSQADEAVPALSRVLWPWQRAISYPEEEFVAEVDVLSPCTDEAFVQEIPEDKPYLLTDPTCGVPTEDVDTPGTTFHVTGYGLEPNAEAELWWRDPAGSEFRQRESGESITVMTDENGNLDIEIVMPYRLLPDKFDAEAQRWNLQARQTFISGGAQASKELKLAIEKMVETIIIGMMATLFGIIMVPGLYVVFQSIRERVQRPRAAGTRSITDA